MRDAILDYALLPLQRAGRSMRQMAKRLNELENALSIESQRLARKFSLIGKGGLCSMLPDRVLKAAIQYEPQVCVGGCSGILGMVWLAFTCRRSKLTKHENELEYLNKWLEKLVEMTTDEQTWRDVTSKWEATLALLKYFKVRIGVAVLQCIASDEKLLEAIGMANELFDTKGGVKGGEATEVVVRLTSPHNHLRTHAYKYDKLISRELADIQQIKGIQLRLIIMATSVVVAIIIATMNLPLSVVAWMVLGPLLLLCCCTCFMHSYWAQLRGLKKRPALPLVVKY